MSNIDKYNFGKIIEEALTSGLKAALIHRITESLIAEFKERVEQEVKCEVEKLTIHSVGHFKNLAQMRDEIKVYCEWVEDKAKGEE